MQTKNDAAAELAQLEAEAKEAENQAAMAAETARMKAEQSLQEKRARLEKLRLHNDVVLPAEANRRAEELKARGAAAPAVENGKAAAEALRLVSSEWASAGDAGRDVYVLQQLQSLAAAAAARVAQSEIGNIKLVAGDDAAYTAVLSSHPNAVAKVLRETGRALGIDIDRLMRIGGSSTGVPRATLPPNPSASPSEGAPTGARPLMLDGPPTTQRLERPKRPTHQGMPSAAPGSDEGGAS